MKVATVLTVYGIETKLEDVRIDINQIKLQQYLPFTVLKLPEKVIFYTFKSKLQQYLPFTVLKLCFFL